MGGINYLDVSDKGKFEIHTNGNVAKRDCRYANEYAASVILHANIFIQLRQGTYTYSVYTYMHSSFSILTSIILHSL